MCCIMFLLPSKFEVINQLQLAQVIAIFLKCAKENLRKKIKKKNIKKIRQTLKAHTSVMARQIWNLPRGNFSKTG